MPCFSQRSCSFGCPLLPWLLRPGQCFHMTLPQPCKLLTKIDHLQSDTTRYVCMHTRSKVTVKCLEDPVTMFAERTLKMFSCTLANPPIFYCPFPVSFRCENSPVFLPIYDFFLNFIYHNLVLALYSGISCFQMSLQFPCGQQYSWIKCCFLACQDRRLLSPCPPQAVRDRERNGQY